jgi:2-polyprenyl-3-methyl-5-hydroxy-6-metoxy-1,4-benzoquinol methylase
MKSTETPNCTADAYTHANPFFVKAVRESPTAKPVILDVGCWNGTLGRALASTRDLIVDGIERNSDQAEHARRAGYRTVHLLDLNRDTIRAAGDRYDFILFGDVLEHLLDPSEVLRASRDLIAPGGKVMVSLPNIAFLTSRLNLLLGRWNYAEYGIMDRTHLKFFTRRTMIQMLQEAGYRVEWSRGYVGLSGYPWIVREPLRWLGSAWPSMFAIQLVACATPADTVDQPVNRGQP